MKTEDSEPEIEKIIMRKINKRSKYLLSFKNQVIEQYRTCIRKVVI